MREFVGSKSLLPERKDTSDWIVLGEKGPSSVEGMAAAAVATNATTKMENNVPLPSLVQHFMAEFVDIHLHLG